MIVHAIRTFVLICALATGREPAAPSSTFTIRANQVKKIEGTPWSVKLTDEPVSDQDGKGSHDLFSAPALELIGPLTSPENGTKHVLVNPITNEKQTVLVGGKNLFPEKIEILGTKAKSALIKVTDTPKTVRKDN